MLNSPMTAAPFFLTRNIANTMDDLVRRLSQGNSVSLISGVSGAGKTRFLEQFYNTYHARFNIVLVRFDAPHSIALAGARESHCVDSFLSDVLEGMQKKSCLIIDQFDRANTDIQQKILGFWNISGLPLELKLVLSVERDNLQNIIELFRCYFFSIDKVELTPLSYEEQLEFIRSLCCDELRQHPRLTASHKKKLKACNGLFANLETFSHQYGHEINCVEKALSRGLSSGLLLTSMLGLLVLILVAAIGFSINRTLDNDFSGSYTSSVPLFVKQGASENSLRSNDSMISHAEIMQPEDNVSEISNAVTTTVEKPPQDTLIERPSIQAESASETIINASASGLEARSDASFFRQGLRATTIWLAESEDKIASIQIMSLNDESDVEQSINRYLEKLAAQKVDLKQIKIFNFVTNGKKMVGVLYGSFDTSAQARSSIDQLPEVLKANRPITRTVRGIRQDVRSE